MKNNKLKLILVGLMAVSLNGMINAFNPKLIDESKKSFINTRKQCDHCLNEAKDAGIIDLGLIKKSRSGVFERSLKAVGLNFFMNAGPKLLNIVIGDEKGSVFGNGDLMFDQKSLLGIGILYCASPLASGIVGRFVEIGMLSKENHQLIASIATPVVGRLAYTGLHTVKDRVVENPEVRRAVVLAALGATAYAFRNSIFGAAKSGLIATGVIKVPTEKEFIAQQKEDFRGIRDKEINDTDLTKTVRITEGKTGRIYTVDEIQHAEIVAEGFIAKGGATERLKRVDWLNPLQRNLIKKKLGLL